MRAVGAVAVTMMACGRLAFDPLEVPPTDRMYAIAAGDQFSCAVRANATVWCWGDNAFGQIGDATGKPHPTPSQITGLANIVAIAAGSAHACALDGTGQ